MSAILTITKRGESGIRFAFESRRRKPFTGAVQEVWEVQIERSALLSFCQKMHAAAEAANQNPLTETALAPFVEAGRGLFCELLPRADPRVRELLAKLRKVKSPLLISTDEPNLYWELLYDDEQDVFLGLKYRLGRRLMTQEVPTNPLRDRQDWRCLMIADPSGNLPQTARETAHLRDWLEARNFRDIDYLSGAGADYHSVLAALSSKSYDLIHYAGHTVLDRKTGEYALELHKREMFRASLIRRQLKGNPLVFLNGCWTGIAKGLNNVPGSVVGLTDAFLAAGAQVVVGSQFQAPDAGARAFAEKFYESMLGGECVGEAMRLARCHVQKAPECAAAWACFVLYGDPAVQLKLRHDPLAQLLDTVGLKREQLDESSLAVVQQALDYAGKSKLVATVELFAALVDSASGLLRIRLEEQGIPAKRLADAFKSKLEKINATAEAVAHGKAGGPRFTENAGTLVRNSATLASGDGARRVSERDLIKTFVRLDGGNTGDILRSIDVVIARLDPDWTPECETPRAADFTTEAWLALLQAARLAGESSTPLLGTPQLFLGLQHNPEGPLRRALVRLHLADALASQRFALNGERASFPTSAAFPPDMPLSPSLRTILADARALAREENRPRMNERDLLTALVRMGAGTVGQVLKKKLNLQPEALASELFLPSNSFDLARFAPALHEPLKQAWIVALKVGHVMLGRRHLFCALLADAQSLLTEALREQQQDAAGLARWLLKQLQPGPRPMAADASPAGISIDLANALVAAETLMRRRQVRMLSEAMLSVSLVEHSQNLGKLFAARGVDWARFTRTVHDAGELGG